MLGALCLSSSRRAVRGTPNTPFSGGREGGRERGREMGGGKEGDGGIEGGRWGERRREGEREGWREMGERRRVNFNHSTYQPPHKLHYTHVYTCMYVHCTHLSSSCSSRVSSVSVADQSHRR